MRISARMTWLAALVLGLGVGFLTAAVAQTPASRAQLAPGEIRLYTINCGHLEFKDLGFFSDTGDYDGGKSGAIAVPCFVIRYPKGILVWDTGLSPHFPKGPGTHPGPPGPVTEAAQDGCGDSGRGSLSLPCRPGLTAGSAFQHRPCGYARLVRPRRANCTSTTRRTSRRCRSLLPTWTDAPALAAPGSGHRQVSRPLH